MYKNIEFWDRAQANLAPWEYGLKGAVYIHDETSVKFFSLPGLERDGLDARLRYSGVVIDGDHDHPNPTTDAAGAVCRLKDRGAILFHDARGGPVKSAVKWLLNYFPELHHRVYPSPHGVVLCWRGELDPPDYVPPPGVPKLEI